MIVFMKSNTHLSRVYMKISSKGDELPNKSLVERNNAPQGLQLVDPNSVTKSSKEDLVVLAREIQKADSFVKANACNKLQVIAEQMKFLRKQAENILLEVNQNMKLNHVACNFVKHPGQVYHLYERESGQCYFSRISPEEWGTSGPSQTYKGSYRLEQDHSWTSVSNIHSKDNELSIFNKLLSNNATLNNSLDTLAINIISK
ncbi:PREDICTED: uncharacterized protein C1orf50 homolog isoform X2 [Polistes canadensis]|uniref:uncharacterized protein C1orf50 homolog isoform X2 n=1 Tax=Polistes canadensis TaxID=91411 RepID=UPI000718B0FA|nr:PREDICTED: uncharacterized protein C1orf50 homolog isoform X2 [Polistes canadensis]